MLTHPTLDQLNALGLQGMAKAFAELNESDEAASLHHAEWLALLLDREGVHRHDKRLGARLRAARLRHQATPEDIDYRSPRGLDRRLMQELLKGDWIGAYENLAITGPTGAGKSWLACALGHQACRDNHAVLYVRAPKLFDELALAHGDGSAGRRLKALGAVQLLILDDWAWERLTRRRATICWKSSKNATAGVPPWSPANSPSLTGTLLSARRPMRTPSSTGWATTPTASSSPANLCAAPAAPRRLDARPAQAHLTIANADPSPGRDHRGMVGGVIPE